MHTLKLKQLCQGSHIHVLDNDVLQLGEQVILGCTLWTDFKLFGDPSVAGYFATQEMNDYRSIRLSLGYRKPYSLDTAGLHFRSRSWLAKQFELQKGKKMIIVTHHAPSPNSLPENYQDDILNAASPRAWMILWPIQVPACGCTGMYISAGIITSAARISSATREVM
jgi:hypothetical protein